MGAHKATSVRELLEPSGGDETRTSDIPNGERDVLVLDSLDVESCMVARGKGSARGRGARQDEREGKERSSTRERTQGESRRGREITEEWDEKEEEGKEQGQLTVRQRTRSGPCGLMRSASTRWARGAV